MSKSTKPSSRSESQLSELARRDATRITPAFSEALHERIMQSVEVASPFVVFDSCLPRSTSAPVMLNYEKSSLPAARRRYLRRGAFAIAAAAVVAVAVVPAVMRFRGRAGTQVAGPLVDHIHQYPVVVLVSHPKTPTPTFNQVTQVVKARVHEVVQMAMAEQQFEGLDHDVRLATHYLVDQMPLRSAWLNDEGANPEQ